MILIAGTGPLANAILQRLQSTGIHAEPLSTETAHPALPAERLERAKALILAADDDSANVDLALQTRQAHPHLPLVVRIFDSTLGGYLSQTISGVSVLSMSRVSAPVFAAAARQVLTQPPPSRPPAVAPARRPRGRASQPDRTLIIALCCLFLLVFPSALVFSQALGIRYMDALYFVWTTVMTVGYGDIALKDASDGIKLFGMGLMLAGASFIAVLFALLSEHVLTRRFEVLHGRVRTRGKGHIIVAGAGNVGYRLAGLLAAETSRLVVIEQDAQNVHVGALRAAGHQVIIADATTRETLELAGVERARLVLALTDRDAVNLQIALHARERGTPVIMRVESPELSAHVTRRGDGIAFSPIDAASEAFCAAALNLTLPPAA